MKPTSFKDIDSLFRQAQAKGIAIAFYRLPKTKTIHYISGPVTQSVKPGETAFAFAPFDPAQKVFYIKDKQASAADYKIQKAKVKSTTKKQYVALVRSIISAIQNGMYTKIVAARVEAMTKPKAFESSVFFQKICTAYPAAFVSLTHIPDVGTWIGASPEILVSQHGERLTTYSLAGTKAIADRTVWTPKDREEQQIVTDFISQKLMKATGSQAMVKGPLTRQAGTIKHLLSIFTLHREGKILWPKVVKALHPTPAVAGLPQIRSVSFIKEKEGFDRRFYAGYLGPVNRDGKTDLFVNLRCLEVTNIQLLFYAGCGVTADSDPDKEWTESERKIDILKSHL